MLTSLGVQRMGENDTARRRECWERFESSGGQARANSLHELCNLLGRPTVPDFVPLYAVVIVLFSLGYFSMASISFLLVPLDVPEVSRLFRGLFNVYLWMVGFTALVVTAVFAASVDTQQTAWQLGDTAAMRRLRLIHWGGMLANIVILASVASSARFIL
jgi:hypothetical protein